MIKKVKLFFSERFNSVHSPSQSTHNLSSSQQTPCVICSIQTCKNLVDTAFNACATGIHKAQDQCLGVMGALGTVYHHARVVLDRINPERWSTKQNSQQQQLHKRQVVTEDGRFVKSPSGKFDGSWKNTSLGKYCMEEDFHGRRFHGRRLPIYVVEITL